MRNRIATLLHLSPLALLSLLLTACQLAPLADYRDRPDLHFHFVDGSKFRHLVVLNTAAASLPSRASDAPVNVYIEGDGRPWSQRNAVALDPTPPVALMLAIMAEDSAAAIYLGRPCYFGVEDKTCTPLHWTHLRYSLAIVESMNTVLDRLLLAGRRVRLIGHSGGGALAMLMASRRSDVTTVVTLAGNLDIERWVQLHEYTPLHGSLNPINYGLPESIRQFHFVGERDKVTPPELVASSVRQISKASNAAEFHLVSGVDHACCWQRVWPDLLKIMGNSRR